MVYLARGGFWLTLGQVVASASGFLLAIAFANLLPKETYGEYKYILSIVGLLSIPTLSGMSNALIRSVARGYEGSLIPAVRTKIKWGFLGGVAALALAGYYFYNDNTTLTFAFLIAGLFIPFHQAAQVNAALLNGRKLFDQSTKYKIISSIITTGGLIATVFFTQNIILIIISYFIINTISRFVLLAIIIKKFKPNKNTEKDTILLGKHLSFVQVLNTIAGQLDKILIWHFLGAAEVAIYSFALAPPRQIRGLTKKIPPLAMPKLAQKDIPTLKKTLPGKVAKLALIVAAVTIIYITAAPFIYHIFFPEYLDSIKYSQIFALSLIVYAIAPIGTTFTAHARKKSIYLSNTITPLVNIALLLVLLPIYNIWGAIAALLITRYFHAVLTLLLFKKL